MKSNIITFITLFFISNLSANRTLYVDNFSNILCNSTEETTLLTFAQNRGITTLLLYELHLIDILNTKEQAMADFISSAKTNYGIMNVGAIGENSNFFSTKIDAYNNNQSSPNEKFDIYNLEFEFWITSSVGSGGYYCTTYLTPGGFPCDTMGGFDFFMQELNAIKTLAQNNSHTIQTETYVGWPNQGQCKETRRVAERILLHAYVSSPTTAYNYADDRLIDFASDNELTDISIIYSSEPAFMQTWLENNTMVAAENIFTTDYNNAGGAWQAYINLLGFTYFAYTDMTNVALPIALDNFSAELVNGSAHLFWRTLFETNFSHFEIEKSIDGIAFSQIGSLASDGSSHAPIEYSFIDKNLVSGTSFYRLKIVDLDGSHQYSKIISLQNEGLYWSIFPNPSQDFISIEIPKDGSNSKTINLFDQKGQLVKILEISQNNIIDLTNIENGLYFLMFDNPSKIQKLVILH